MGSAALPKRRWSPRARPGATRAAHTVTQAEIDSNGGGDGLLENTATADSNETGPDTDDASVPVDRRPSLNIAKDATVPDGTADAVGDVLHYTVTVTNTGNVTLTGVTVVDPLTGQNISGVTLAPGANQRSTPANADPGRSRRRGRAAMARHRQHRDRRTRTRPAGLRQRGGAAGLRPKIAIDKRVRTATATPMRSATS